MEPKAEKEPVFTAAISYSFALSTGKIHLGMHISTTFLLTVQKDKKTTLSATSN